MILKKATSPDSPQALSSTEMGAGGSRPQALSLGLRQIVAGTICHVDTQNVARPVAQGHRQKNHKCDDLSCSKKIFSVRLSPHVKFNNGGENGIKLRLQKYRLQQLEQGRSRNGSRILLDTDGCRNPIGNRKELERNFIPDLIFTKSWTWTLDKGPGTKSYNWMVKKVHWLWNQCWRKVQSQMAARSSKLRGSRCRKHFRECFERIGVCGWTIILDRSLLFLSQLSTVKPTVDTIKTGTLLDELLIECLTFKQDYHWAETQAQQETDIADKYYGQKNVDGHHR